MPFFKLKNKVILFIHIPKAAGSSVEKILEFNDIEQSFLIQKKNHISSISPQHFTREDYRIFFNKNFFDHSFAIIRDPIERFRSAFIFNSHKIPPIISVNKFLDLLCKKDFFYKNFDNHFVPSSRFINSETKLFFMDKHGAFINDIVVYLSTKFDRKISLPENNHINSINEKKVSTNFFKTLIKRTLQRSPGSLYSQDIEYKIKEIYAEDYFLINQILKND